MDTQGLINQVPAATKDSKHTISKLRAKVNPEHANFMGEAWLASPDGQDALRRIAAYNPGRATPGRNTLAARIAVRTQLASIKATAEETRDDMEQLLQRAQGKLAEKHGQQSSVLTQKGNV